MSYWQQVQTAAGMGGNYHWVIFGCVVAAFALAAISPASRKRLRASLLLIIVAVIAMLICGLLLYRGVLEADATGYRWIHYVGNLCLAIAIINLIGVLVFRVLLPSIRLQPPPILRDTVLGLLYVAAALSFLAREGVNLSGIVATSAVVTAIIGFSLQDTLGNVMGGMSLQLERSIRIGDWVRLGDIEGRVSEIRWRHTSIETRNWDTVIVPNSVLMKAQVTILGRREGAPSLHRMWVNFNVDYRHAASDVIDSVEAALRAEAIPNVAASPPPECILNDFRESNAQYAVRYWLTNFSKDSPTSSEVRTRVLVALQRKGIAIAVPAQNVSMTLENRSRQQQQEQEELRRRTAALKGVMIFEPLTDEERQGLAPHLILTPFRRGEVITRQGNEAHHLYIIIRGEVEVLVGVTPYNGDAKRVATLSPGDVFGEMALMTGERRAATITAITDVVCYRLDKEGFQEVLNKRPEIAESVSELLARRKVELDGLTAGLTSSTHSRIEDTRGDLLRRIRKFFTLG